MKKTPKEKAEEIYNKHYISIQEYGEDLGQEIIVSLLAKKASIIGVDGIIKTLNEIGEKMISEIGTDSYIQRYINYDKIKHFEEVKQELEKR